VPCAGSVGPSAQKILAPGQALLEEALLLE
jgi:hypothetical protein